MCRPPAYIIPPETIVTRGEVVYRARKFNVERQRFEHAGQQHEYEIIIHPGAAVVLPILNDGRVVMIENYRLAVDDTLLEVPAGTLDPQEDPRACAARELTEETGYHARTLTPLVAFFSTPGILNERMHVFLATDLTAGETAHEPSEIIHVKPMEYDEVMRAIADGRIVDGKTIVSLLYYDRYLRCKDQTQ